MQPQKQLASRPQTIWGQVGAGGGVETESRMTATLMSSSPSSTILSAREDCTGMS